MPGSILVDVLAARRLVQSQDNRFVIIMLQLNRALDPKRMFKDMVCTLAYLDESLQVTSKCLTHSSSLVMRTRRPTIDEAVVSLLGSFLAAEIILDDFSNSSLLHFLKLLRGRGSHYCRNSLALPASTFSTSKHIRQPSHSTHLVHHLLHLCHVWHSRSTSLAHHLHHLT